jgi:DNA-binding transcriptional regulator YiaG
MTSYVAERRNGSWRVVDADGQTVKEYGPGADAAERARATADQRNHLAPATEVRAWRKARSLSQQKLADLLGVRWLTVQRWEAGTSGIPPYLHLALKQLERELDV